MKSLVFTLAAFMVLLAVSCKKSNTPAPATTTTTAVTSTTVHPTSNGSTPTTTVYFAGTDGADAVYWQNGVEHNLPIADHNDNNSGPVLAYTHNMAVTG